MQAAAKRQKLSPPPIRGVKRQLSDSIETPPAKRNCAEKERLHHPSVDEGAEVADSENHAEGCNPCSAKEGDSEGGDDEEFLLGEVAVEELLAAIPASISPRTDSRA